MSFCAQSDALFCEFRVHLFYSLMASMFLLVRVVRILSSSLLNPLRQSLHISRSSTKRDRCLSGNYFKFLNYHCNPYLVSKLARILSSLVTRSSADADKPARRVWRSVKVTKHSTIPYVRYSFLLCNSNFVFKTRRFYAPSLRLLRYSTSKNVVTLKWGQR